MLTHCLHSEQVQEVRGYISNNCFLQERKTHTHADTLAENITSVVELLLKECMLMAKMKIYYVKLQSLFLPNLLVFTDGYSYIKNSHKIGWVIASVVVELVYFLFLGNNSDKVSRDRN